jgi:long-subunit fatty acid transport protein
MKLLATFATVCASVAMGSSAFAEGGYYAGTLGAQASGRSGAFTAKADDLTAVSYNPAGLAKIETPLIQIGNQFSYNASSFTRASTTNYAISSNPTVNFNKVKNGAPWQALDPLMGVTSNLGLRDWGFALAAYAPPGASKEEFPADGGQRYLMASREVMMLKFAGSAAWKYADLFGVGATAEWIYVPSLKYSIVIDGTNQGRAANPVSSGFDVLATMTGSAAFTFNAILGAWYRPAPFLEFGLSGQVVPTNIVAHSNLAVSPIGSQFGGDPITLSRSSGLANDVTLTLPLPMLFRSGARYRHLEGGREIYDIELDVEYETWSRVNRFTVDTNGLQADGNGQHFDLKQINVEKHWRDTIAVKLGGDYAVIPDQLTLRGGGFYESAVSDAAYANVDFSSGPKIGGSVGASIFFGRMELAVAYQLRFQPTVSVSEADGRVYQQVPGSPCTAPYTDTTACNEHYLGKQGTPTVNAGTYNAMSHIVALDVLYRY